MTRVVWITGLLGASLCACAGDAALKSTAPTLQQVDVDSPSVPDEQVLDAIESGKLLEPVGAGEPGADIDTSASPVVPQYVDEALKTPNDDAAVLALPKSALEVTPAPLPMSDAEQDALVKVPNGFLLHASQQAWSEAEYQAAKDEWYGKVGGAQ